jgi:hypothetical protein
MQCCLTQEFKANPMVLMLLKNKSDCEFFITFLSVSVAKGVSFSKTRGISGIRERMADARQYIMTPPNLLTIGDQRAGSNLIRLVEDL